MAVVGGNGSFGSTTFASRLSKTMVDFRRSEAKIAATVQAAGNQPAHQLHRRLVVLVHEPVSRLIELVELLGDDCVYHLEIDPEVLVRNQVVKDRRP